MKIDTLTRASIVGVWMSASLGCVEMEVDELRATEEPQEAQGPEAFVDGEQGAPATVDPCDPATERALTVEWAGELAEGSSVRHGSVLPWTLTNHSGEVQRVDLVATFDRGQLSTRSGVLDSLELQPGARHVGRVDLGELVTDLEGLDYSGMVMLSALIPGGPASVGEPRFFHPTGAGGLLVYDEATMRAEFGAGDFRGRATQRDEPGVVTTRVVSAKDVIHGVDDQLEPEVRDGQGDGRDQEVAR
ncbi:hypothetical protein [Plesiocystis pacifica]|uniref:hypothetical protein n=1 Tax=Plesiocystis pacifica TaxID=191768 RepID=UPI0012FBCA57|nr:hypothetical protein [Plesiocystis pacifica]